MESTETNRDPAKALEEYLRLLEMGVKKIVAAQKVGFTRQHMDALHKAHIKKNSPAL